MKDSIREMYWPSGESPSEAMVTLIPGLNDHPVRFKKMIQTLLENKAVVANLPLFQDKERLERGKRGQWLGSLRNTRKHTSAIAECYNIPSILIARSIGAVLEEDLTHQDGTVYDHRFYLSGALRFTGFYHKMSFLAIHPNIRRCMSFFSMKSQDPYGAHKRIGFAPYGEAMDSYHVVQERGLTDFHTTNLQDEHDPIVDVLKVEEMQSGMKTGNW